jgi:hypothetical protein
MRALCALVVLAACPASARSPGGTTDAATTSDGHTGHHPDAAPDSPGQVAPAHVFTIVLENHDYAEIVGNTNDAPYINSLIAQYGLATSYRDTGHPSLPNYLNMVSGANQFPGGSDPSATTSPFPVSQPHLGTQLQSAGIAWRAYVESMGNACNLNDNYPYAQKHVPFLYFTDIQNNSTLCNQVVVDYGQFAGDLASGNYRYMWITPNLLSDGHDPLNDPPAGLRQSDQWLASNLPAILQSAAYQQRGVVFVTWDEAEGRNGDDPDLIPMIVISPMLPFQNAHLEVSSALDHGSYTATVEDLLGLPRLQTVAQSSTMMDMFVR